MDLRAAAIDLGAVFADRWEGGGRVWRPWWLRWLPLPTSFTFRSERSNVTGDSWDVLDTLTFPNGRVRQRTMQARQLASDEIRVTAKDMPGGAILRSHADGFDFSPYVIRTPIIGPIRLPLRHQDSVKLHDDDTMIDTIELRLAAVHVGTVTMRLKRVAHPEATPPS
jgi:hypothetical protein